ncbi:MAG: hypothetical protein D6737_07290 [Chloroflexi bacterium]|nr:MAG: hypothetical protein D6737_07290 [Chloroflexota bacterium]
MRLRRRSHQPLAFQYFFGIGLLIVGVLIGIDFPDIDQRTVLLNHRSLLTHGFIAPVILFRFVYLYRSAVPRLFGVGVCTALLVHLAFDLFPRAWTGFALLTVPVFGRTSALFSKIWLVLSVIVLFYLTLLLIQTLLEFLLATGSLILSVIAYAPGEPAVIEPVLLMTVCAIVVVAILPSPGGVIARKFGVVVWRLRRIF